MPKLTKKEEQLKQGKNLKSKSSETIVEHRRTLRSQNGKTFKKTKLQEKEAKGIYNDLCCSSCGEHFSSKTLFKRHMSSAHEDVTLRNEPKRDQKRRVRIHDNNSDSKEKGITALNRSTSTNSTEDVGKNSYDSSLTSDEKLNSTSEAALPTPTTCNRCKHTYRSIISYENHISSCIPYSSSSSEEWDTEDVKIEEKSNKHHPEYEEEVVMSEDDYMVSDSSIKSSCSNKFNTNTNMIETSFNGGGGNKVYSHEVTPTTNITQVPNTISPTKTFSTFSISSIVAQKEPSSCDPKLNPCSPGVASIERFFLPTTTSYSDTGKCGLKFTNPNIQQSPQIPKSQVVFNDQSVSTQVNNYEQRIKSTSELPILDRSLKNSNFSDSSTQSLNTSFRPSKSSSFTPKTHDGFRSPVTHFEHDLTKESPLVKPVPIHVPPELPKLGTSYFAPNLAQHQDPGRMPNGPAFHNNSMNNNSINYPPTISHPSLSPYSTNYNAAPTETITLQDAKGQVMRVQMPTVPSLSTQTQSYHLNYSLNNQIGSYGVPQLQQNPQPLNMYQHDLQSYHYQHQPHLPVQHNQFQAVVQPQLQLNSSQMLNFQQQPYYQQSYLNSNATQQNVIPWLNNGSSIYPSGSPFQTSPSVQSSYSIGQPYVNRNDNFVLVQQDRAFSATLSPQIPLQSTHVVPSLNPYSNNSFSNVLHNNSSVPHLSNSLQVNSMTGVPVVKPINNMKHHVCSGSGLSQPCSCELCLAKKNGSNNGDKALIRSKNHAITTTKIQQQFQKPTWSSNAFTNDRRLDQISDTPDWMRFKKILPNPSQSVEGLAAALASSPLLVKSQYSATPSSNSTVAFVKPLENPLQKLSDQISQIGSINSHLSSPSKHITYTDPVNHFHVMTHPPSSKAPEVAHQLEAEKVAKPIKILSQQCKLPSQPSGRKRQGDNSEDQPLQPTKRKYKKRIEKSEVDQNEKSIRVTLKRNQGDTKYTVKSVRQTGFDNSGSMKSLKIKAKIDNGESNGKKCAITEVVVTPHVHVIPIPSDEGHRVVKEGDDGTSNPPDSEADLSTSEPNAIVTTANEMTHRAVILYDIRCQDAVLFRSCDVRTVWGRVFELVHGTKMHSIFSPLSFPSKEVSIRGNKIELDPNSGGIVHSAIEFLLKELPSKNNAKPKKMKKKDLKSKKKVESDTEESIEGCARLEGFQERKRFDMFGWLASKHRNLPCIESLETTKSEMPISLANMRYKHLREKSPRLLNVFYSTIHGRGLFTRRDIQEGEMVIEYAGEVIRSILCDNREKMYESKGYGCYMFKIDEYEVVDATMRGNAARFINHSCDPNCKSKVVEIMGKPRILIFALRKILGGEELTYDYNFVKEHKDKKIPCTCGAIRCRKFLN